MSASEPRPTLEIQVGHDAQEEEDHQVSQEFKKPNTFHIRVIEGRGFKSSSLRSTVSSYVKLTCGPRERKTAIQSKTLEPQWDETFSFLATDWTTNVTLVVSDKANIRKRFLGQIRLTTSELEPHVRVKKWLALRTKHWTPPPPGTPALGELAVEILWSYSRANDPVLRQRETARRSRLSSLHEGLVLHPVSEHHSNKKGQHGTTNDEDEAWDLEQLEGIVVEQEEETEREKAARKRERRDLQYQQGVIDTSFKRGQYQVQVHIIEARDLKGEGLSGTSDPICNVEVMGKKKHTKTHRRTLGCVFDEMLFFHFDDIGREELEQGHVKISVYDANRVMRNALIGTHQIDCMSICYRANHELYRHWLALMDYDNKNDQGIQGFVMVSVVILGPGDKPLAHDRVAEFLADRSGFDSSLVLLPPSINQRLNYLVMSVYRAEDLPPLDRDGMFSRAGIDAYVQVEFGGNPAAKTSVVTIKGTSGLAPAFYEELWIPIMMPSMASRIDVSVWDRDRGSKNDLVGRFALDFKHVIEDSRPGGGSGPLSTDEDLNQEDTDGGAAAVLRENATNDAAEQQTTLNDTPPPSQLSNPRWCNIYGPPLEHAMNTKEALAIHQFHRNEASTYRGRVLLGCRRVLYPDASEIEIPVTKDIVMGNDSTDSEHVLPEPPTLRYTLRAIVVMASDVSPDAHSYRLSLTLGSVVIHFHASKAQNGHVMWNESKERRGLVLPADLTQLPDVVLHLSRLVEGDKYASVAFARRRASDIMTCGFDHAPVEWVTLSEERARRGTKLGPSSSASARSGNSGHVLLRLGFGREEVAATAKPWLQDPLYDAILNARPCEVRVHVYQCKDLSSIKTSTSGSGALMSPTTMSGQPLHPYVSLSFFGQTIKSSRKSRTADPRYYETLTLQCDLSQLEACIPPFFVQVRDVQAKFGSDVVLGHVLVPFQASMMNSGLARSPQPKWLSLSSASTSSGNTGNSTTAGQPNDGNPNTENPDHENGQILMDIQVIEKRSKADVLVPAPSIEPTTRTAYLEIMALGVRQVKPYHFVPIQRPYVHFEIVGGQSQNTSKLIKRTQASNKPEGSNANFLERLVIPIELPDDPLYCPQLKLQVFDTRLGGLQTSSIASSVIDLRTKIPWNVNEYIPPQQQAFDHHDQVLKARKRQQSSEKKAGARHKSEESNAAESYETKSRHDDDDHANLMADPFEYEGESVNDNGLGMGSFELQSVVTTVPSSINKSTSKRDPASRAQHRLAKARRFQADVADAKSKGHVIQHSHGDEHDLEEEEPEENDDSLLDKPNYFQGRDWWIRERGGELEEYLDTAPFETYALFRPRTSSSLIHTPASSSASSILTEVGKFKGLIRITESDPTLELAPSSSDAPKSQLLDPFVDFHQLREPQEFEVRVYILKAQALQPRDRNGFSDPYLKVTLGKQKVSTRKRYIKKTLAPVFGEVMTFHTTIPGPSQLDIAVWDHDVLSSDDFIGRTTVDLEDRWFHPKWQHAGEDHVDIGVHGSLKPIEYRQLWSDTASTSQGMLQLWIDILPMPQAKLFPPISIAPPEKEKFEVRVIVWKSEEVMDRNMSDINDLFVTCFLEGMKHQSTDVHWRCSTGKAAWNYRLKFPIELPLDAPEKARLHLQLWEKDIIKWNDVIGEAQIDLYKYFQKAYQTKDVVMPFKDTKARSRTKKKKKKNEKINNTSTQELNATESDERLETQSFQSSSSIVDSEDDTEDEDEEEESEDEDEDLESGERLNYDDAQASSLGEHHTLLASSSSSSSSSSKKKKKTRKTVQKKGLMAKVLPKFLRAPLMSLWGSGGSSGDPHALGDRAEMKKNRDENEAKEAITSFLDFIGMGRLPDDGEWINMYYTDRTQGVAECLGKLAISVQIVPEHEFTSMPVGSGRDDPNVNPYLPPPLGRMKVSANPLMVIKELVGPKLCAKICCLLCCGICMGFTALFGAGIMSTLTFIQQMNHE